MRSRVIIDCTELRQNTDIIFNGKFVVISLLTNKCQRVSVHARCTRIARIKSKQQKVSATLLLQREPTKYIHRRLGVDPAADFKVRRGLSVLCMHHARMLDICDEIRTFVRLFFCFLEEHSCVTVLQP